jgi:hypothetical protein
MIREMRDEAASIDITESIVLTLRPSGCERALKGGRHGKTCREEIWRAEE